MRLFAALTFGAGFSCAKTSAADLLVQKYIEKREEVDWKRNGAFAAFGLVYLGGVQYAIYVPVFSRLFPSASTFIGKSFRQKLADVPGMLNVAMKSSQYTMISIRLCSARAMHAATGAAARARARGARGASPASRASG